MQTSAADGDTWVTLERYRSYGTIYAYPGESRGRNAKPLKLKAGQIFQVQWPSGFISHVKLIAKTSMLQIDAYAIEDIEFGFEESFRGLRIWIDLTEVKIKSDTFERSTL